MADNNKFLGMGGLGWGTLLSSIPALAQGIFGAIQAGKANKRFNKLQANRPQYEIPEEYKSILAEYQKAYASDMPGYSQTLGQIGQAGARARGGAERGAISSTAYGSQVGDIYQKELDALTNLGVQQAQYKASMLDKVTGAQAGLGEQKAQQWNVNEYVPWQTEMNRMGEQKQAGLQNLFSGLQGIGSNISDLVGTKYLTDALKGLYPQGTSSILGGNKSALVGGTYNPQQNLLNTATDILKGITLKHP